MCTNPVDTNVFNDKKSNGIIINNSKKYVTSILN